MYVLINRKIPKYEFKIKVEYMYAKSEQLQLYWYKSLVIVLIYIMFNNVPFEYCVCLIIRGQCKKYNNILI